MLRWNGLKGSKARKLKALGSGTIQYSTGTLSRIRNPSASSYLSLKHGTRSMPQRVSEDIVMKKDGFIIKSFIVCNDNSRRVTNTPGGFRRPPIFAWANDGVRAREIEHAAISGPYAQAIRCRMRSKFVTGRPIERISPFGDLVNRLLVSEWPGSGSGSPRAFGKSKITLRLETSGISQRNAVKLSVTRRFIRDIGDDKAIWRESAGVQGNFGCPARRRRPAGHRPFREAQR